MDAIALDLNKRVKTARTGERYSFVFWWTLLGAGGLAYWLLRMAAGEIHPALDVLSAAGIVWLAGTLTYSSRKVMRENAEWGDTPDQAVAGLIRLHQRELFWWTDRTVLMGSAAFVVFCLSCYAWMWTTGGDTAQSTAYRMALSLAAVILATWLLGRCRVKQLRCEVKRLEDIGEQLRDAED
ncbi:MAG: hypothetical protein AAF533_20885 [Acidobacteriota bacterium]